jgi:MoaA/NifB/PqqE/SkfB family radical SAM enzyme
MAVSTIDFPQSISLTITNHCNLRCQMCGQWSEQGYVRGDTGRLRREMTLADWKRVVDELAAHGAASLLLRGGEPFMLPGIVELLEYIHNRGMFISIDTNGTLLDRYAEDIVRLGNIHLTVSVDGPEEVHDAVRGIPGTFQRLKQGLARIAELEAAGGKKISRSICFTISQYNYRSLGAMPGVARALGLGSIAIVPYYYFPEKVGQEYDRELQALGCSAFSWVGFHHEESGVDFEEFRRQLRKYKETLGEVSDYPYLKLSEEEYRAWFTDTTTPVGPHQNCTNVEKLIDIQPDGSANFCVDFADYSIGNVKDASLEELWNGARAERFRRLRREKPLAVCYRCGAKYMSEIAS